MMGGVHECRYSMPLAASSAMLSRRAQSSCAASSGDVRARFSTSLSDPASVFGSKEGGRWAGNVVGGHLVSELGRAGSEGPGIDCMHQSVVLPPSFPTPTVTAPAPHLVHSTL